MRVFNKLRASLKTHKWNRRHKAVSTHCINQYDDHIRLRDEGQTKPGQRIPRSRLINVSKQNFDQKAYLTNSSDARDGIFRLWGPITQACWCAGSLSRQCINMHGVGCVGQTSCVFGLKLRSCTWVKPNPRYDSNVNISSIIFKTIQHVKS